MVTVELLTSSGLGRKIKVASGVPIWEEGALKSRTSPIPAPDRNMAIGLRANTR